MPPCTDLDTCKDNDPINCTYSWGPIVLYLGCQILLRFRIFINHLERRKLHMAKYFVVYILLVIVDMCTQFKCRCMCICYSVQQNHPYDILSNFPRQAKEK